MLIQGQCQTFLGQNLGGNPTASGDLPVTLGFGIGSAPNLVGFVEGEFVEGHLPDPQTHLEVGIAQQTFVGIRDKPCRFGKAGQPDGFGVVVAADAGDVQASRRTFGRTQVEVGQSSVGCAEGIMGHRPFGAFGMGAELGRDVVVTVGPKKLLAAGREGGVHCASGFACPSE